jgi:hypothetical protein
MRKKHLVLLLICATGFLVTLAVVLYIRTPRIIGRAVAPNGIEFIVFQRYDPHVEPFEPFRTTCYYRRPGGPWGWFYFDHEDSYWRRAEMVIDTHAKQIKVFRRHSLVVTFGWENEEYNGFKNGKFIGRSLGAEGWKPPEWNLKKDR